ncbi:hypothetical protein FDK21_20380 [Cohaesibacter sp. CAU 1516]|uniref:hypothetical protein n=1 Tax=Cohaesibacter sp. CAU 1516 TaxID=2576038 RepID=UPI0010FD9D2C|nr:hypothetical protein [Cohaesibacter sp. CAU 1516]TLP41901.1 hypothetical protein FDK21_20380 [Cohaesibacter sp. CAU 1516]
MNYKSDRICVIGTSQVSALKKFIDTSNKIPVTVDFFGSNNSAYINRSIKYNDANGTIEALSDTIREAWGKTAGKTHIKLSDYSRAIVFGCDQFEYRNRFFLDYHKTFLSTSCVKQLLLDCWATHPANVILTELEKYNLKLPISVRNGPFFSVKHNYFVNAPADFDFSESRILYEKFMHQACGELGARFFPQPTESVGPNGITTIERYLLEDGFHLTKEAAGEFFLSMISIDELNCP